MKLSLCFSFLVTLGLGLGSVGCAGLGQYGMMGQPAGGAPAAGSGGPGAPTTTNPSDPSATTATSASGPSSVSVDIKSSCSKTVKVFYGDKPKFGSGTYSTASANSRSSHSFRPGDQFWIVDESENGVANVSIQDSTKEIEILGSCTQLALR
jgi:hypothetical protein